MLLEEKKEREINKKEPFGTFIKKERYFHLEKEVIETKRVVKVTRGGRRFSFAALVLVKDSEKNSIAYVYVKGKEMGTLVKKALNKAKKRMITFFPGPVQTIPRDIFVKYKSTKLFLKPAPKGNGIKAGGPLNTFFKQLGVADVSAKIFGSRNKLTVIKAAFLALKKITEKTYAGY